MKIGTTSFYGQTLCSSLPPGQSMRSLSTFSFDSSSRNLCSRSRREQIMLRLFRVHKLQLEVSMNWISWSMSIGLVVEWELAGVPMNNSYCINAGNIILFFDPSFDKKLMGIPFQEKRIKHVICPKVSNTFIAIFGPFILFLNHKNG